MCTFLEGRPAGFGSYAATLDKTHDSLTEPCQQHIRGFSMSRLWFFFPCVASENFVISPRISAFGRSVKDSGKMDLITVL